MCKLKIPFDNRRLTSNKLYKQIVSIKEYSKTYISKYINLKLQIKRFPSGIYNSFIAYIGLIFKIMVYPIKSGFNAKY